MIPDFSTPFSQFREQRVIFFAMARERIPFPARFEEFNSRLELCKAERDKFHKEYQRTIESLPTESVIAPDVLRSFSDEEAASVFAALEDDGISREDILLLRTRRDVERGLAHCRQQVHEQSLLIQALRDVSTAQTLLYEYMQEQTALENLGNNPEKRKDNRALAMSLLNVISKIGSGDCLFPPDEEGIGEEKKSIAEWERREVKERKKKHLEAREEFRYHCIRECEKLRDGNGNAVLSMPLLRSLAFLHLRFNCLHVEKAMDAQSIALPGRSGGDLLTLARSDLDPAQGHSLIVLSNTLRKGDEPVVEDMGKFPAAIEVLPPIPKLILSLLYKDITEACPTQSDGASHMRMDLVEQHRNGGDIITNKERAVIMRELIEYLADYMEALEKSERDEKSEGFTVRNAFRIYKLLRENARKYIFQSAVDFLYLTGSDHGVKHLIQGDVRLSTKVAEKLNWSARDRVYLRQIAADHDMGYTHTALQLFSMHEDGIPLVNGYYDLLRDHPLYSSAHYEVHRPEYEQFFGKEGAKIMGLSMLDHSEVKGNLLDPDPAKRIQALFCRMDCLGVSADIKAAPAFMRGRVLVAMSKAMEAAEYLKDIDGRLEKLWKDNKVRSPEYKWWVAMQASLRTIAGQVKKRLLKHGRVIYDDRVLQHAYYRAVDRHFDPHHPLFPVQRDFGSNAIEFVGIDAYADARRSHISVQFDVQPLFFAVAEYFGKEQGPRFAMSAIKKLIEDFGGAIHDPLQVVEAFEELSKMGEGPFSEKDIEKQSEGGMEYGQRHATPTYFAFGMPKHEEYFPLIGYMTEHMPLLAMMRKIIQSEFKRSRLFLLLEKIGDKMKIGSKKILLQVQKGNLEMATEEFLKQHFRLPK